MCWHFFWEPWRRPRRKRRTRPFCGCCRCCATAARSQFRNKREIRLVAAGPGTTVAAAGGAHRPGRWRPPICRRSSTKRLPASGTEKIGLRGYTQFRIADVLNEDGPALEVPQRSLGQCQRIADHPPRPLRVQRRSPERVSLYAQMDFNGSTGAADFAVQMRDLYADVWLDQAKLWRVRLGQSKVPYGWANLQSSQNRAALDGPMR